MTKATRDQTWGALLRFTPAFQQMTKRQQAAAIGFLRWAAEQKKKRQAIKA